MSRPLHGPTATLSTTTMLRRITDAAIDHPLVTLLAAAFILLLGGYATTQLPVERDPDIAIPVIVVTVPYPAASPSEVEQAILIPLERRLQGLDGLDYLRASAQQGAGVVACRFLEDADLHTAKRDIADRVELARAEFPAGAQAPVVVDLTLGDVPIMLVTVAATGAAPDQAGAVTASADSGVLDIVALRNAAKDLAGAIEVVPGVAVVELYGGRERRVEVVADPATLRDQGFTMLDIERALATQHFDVPGGRFHGDQHDRAIHVDALVRDPADLAQIQITSPLGHAKPLGDLATIQHGLTDVESLSRVNGAPCVTLIVQRKAKINVLATNDGVRAAIDAYRARLPDGIAIAATQDIGKEIREMQGQLGSSAIFGALIVIALLFVAVGLRNALFVIIAIPLTVVIAALAFWATGESLNNMTLFSLIVILGLVVDGATIVVENIHRQFELGRTPLEAAKLGIHEVAASVLVADITTIAAFLPILFLSGPTGEFMALLPITVTVTLIGSLLVDHFLLPTLMARLMPSKPHGPRRSLLGAIARTTRLYRGTWVDVARPGVKSTLDAAKSDAAQKKLGVTLTPPSPDDEGRRGRAALPNTVRIGLSDTRSSRKDSTMRSRRDDPYGETALRLRLPTPPVEVIDNDGAQLLADVLLHVARDPFTRVRIREATTRALASDLPHTRTAEVRDDTRRRADLRYDKGDRLSEHVLAARTEHRATRRRGGDAAPVSTTVRINGLPAGEKPSVSTPEALAGASGSLESAFAELDMHADTLRIESEPAQPSLPLPLPPTAPRAREDGTPLESGKVDPFAAFDRSQGSDSARARRALRPTSGAAHSGAEVTSAESAEKPAAASERTSTEAAMAGALKQMVELSQTTWIDGEPPPPPRTAVEQTGDGVEGDANPGSSSKAEAPASASSSGLVALASDTRRASARDGEPRTSAANPDHPNPPAQRAVEPVPPGAIDRLRDVYENLLRRLMRASPLVHLTLLLAFAGALIAMFAFKIVGFEYMPNVDRSRFVIRAEHPTGTPIESTQQTLQRLEAVLQHQIDERAQAGLPPLIENYVSIAGETNALQADIRDRQAAGPEQGKIQVELVEVSARDMSQVEILAMIERNLPTIDGVTITVEQISEGPPAGADLAIRLTGDEYTDLERASAAVARLLSDTPGARDIESDYRPTRPELTVKIDRQRAADARVQPAVIARIVQLACSGAVVNGLEFEGEPIDIVLLAPRAVAESVTAIAALPVPTDTGGLVALGDVADVDPTTGANSRMRFNGRRAITVRCNLAEGARLSDVQAAFDHEVGRDATLRELVPQAVTLTYGGETEERDRSYRELTVALAVGIALVLFILVAYFNSAARALVILAVVPLGLIGVLIGLLITGNTFNILSFVGIVALTGIVVNDAIVLVDFERQARRNGSATRADGVHESAVHAARLRLRPIVLTTLTTVGGLLPLALHWGGTNEFWEPLCWAIIFGLAFATTMTLLVLPVLLNDVLRLRDAVSQRDGGFWRMLRALIS